MAEITVTDLLEYLQQVKAPTGSINETLLPKILDRAKATVTSYLRKHMGHRWTGFGPYVTGTKDIRSWETRNLWLPPHDIGTVSLVQRTGITMLGWTEDTESGYLYLVPVNQLTYLTPNWGNWIYAVTADWGYGPTPDDVNQVYLEVATNFWRGKETGMYQTYGAGDGSRVKFIGGMNDTQREVLDNIVALYKRPAMGVELQTIWGEEDHELEGRWGL